MDNDKSKGAESMGKQRKQNKRTPSTQEPGVTNNHNMKNIPDMSYDPKRPNNSRSAPMRYKVIALNTMTYDSGYPPREHRNPSMTNQPNLTYSSIMTNQPNLTDTKDAPNNVIYIDPPTDLRNPSMTNHPKLIYKPSMPRNTGSPDMTYTANADNIMHDNTGSPYNPNNLMVDNPNSLMVNKPTISGHRTRSYNPIARNTVTPDTNTSMSNTPDLSYVPYMPNNTGSPILTSNPYASNTMTRGRR